MYLYDFDSFEKDVKQLHWAKKAYENFIDFKNDILLCEGKKPLNEFPIIGSTFTELIEFWTQFYAVNTMRLLLTLINKLQKQSLNNGFTKEDFRLIDSALAVAKTKRDKMKRDNNERLEGLGKAPAFYPVLLHILNLVPTNFNRYNFYISIFLFMLNTGQRFITSSNVLLTDIKDVIFLQDKFIVKIIARITKCNADWNQNFNIEGALNEKSMMNFVFWLNRFLKEEHDLELKNFNKWDQNDIKNKYLWGKKNDLYKPNEYSSVYKTWRLFYTKAGVPDKLLGVHSFRSGFYCQSILNSQKKSLDINTMKELSQLLAGWKTKSDAAIYFKKEMDEQVTIFYHDEWINGYNFMPKEKFTSFEIFWIFISKLNKL
jgi:hypothetical protein